MTTMTTSPQFVLELNTTQRMRLFDLVVDVIRDSDVDEYSDFSTVPPSKVTRGALLTIAARNSESMEVSLGGRLRLVPKATR